MQYNSNITPNAHSGRDIAAKKKIAEGFMAYMQGKEMVHNILTKGVQEEEGLEYTNAKTRVLVTFIQYAHVHFQLPKALRRFGDEGKNAAKLEVKQLHDQTCFKVLGIA